MKNIGLIGLGCSVLLIGCTDPTPSEPTMTLDEAMTFCRAEIIEDTRTKTTVGVGVGISGGDVKPRGNISVSVNLSTDAQKQDRFETCVIRNSGEEPTETF